MNLSSSIRKTLRGFKTSTSMGGHVDQHSAETVSGWAADNAAPGTRLLVLLVRDGRPVDFVRADGFRQDLVDAGVGDGRHGFTLRIVKGGEGLEEIYAVSDAVAKQLRLLDATGAISRGITREMFREMASRARGQLYRVQGARHVPVRSETRIRRQSDKPVVLLEIVDLLSFFNFHNRVTGIQRVVSSIIRSTLSHPEAYEPFEFIVSTDGDDVLVLPRKLLLATIDRLLEGNISQQELIEAIARIRTEGERLTPKKGDRFVITGAYWIVNNYGPTLLRLKAKGVITAAYIYDLIPITASEYVTDATRDEVVERGIEVLSICDFFMTISEFVEAEVQELLRNELGRRGVTRNVPLPHEIPYRLPEETRLPPIYPRPYALCVGTLEGRKNHALLFKIWAGLIRKYGIDAVPDLVLVGKWGWKIDAFRALCTENAFLADKIFVMQGITDMELSVLYRDCLFTLFPSLVEGWGLPVGESLAAGKFCIASNTSSVPEVGGSFVDYISPYDYFGAFRVVEKVVTDRGYLAERERNVHENFKPRTWDDTTRLFHAAIADLSRALPEQAPRIPTLRAGEFYPVQHTKGALITWASREIKFILGEGWYPLEHWGTWGCAPDSTIRFFTGLAEGEELLVLLRLTLPPGREQGSVAVSDEGSGGGWSPLSGSRPNLVEVGTTVGGEGKVELTIRLQRFEPFEDGSRTLFVGLTGIAYCRRSDPNGAAEMLRAMGQTRAVAASAAPVRA